MSNSNDNSSTIISDDYQVTTQIEKETTSEIASFERKLSAISNLLLLANLLILPFLFGGVHEANFLTFHIATFLLLSTIIAFQFPSTLRIVNLEKAQGKVFFNLLALMIFLCAHGIFYYFQQISHPVFGSVSRLLNPHIALNIVIELANFISLYFITLYWLDLGDRSSSKRRVQFLSNIILLSAFLVSLTALSHWFYDNGKLFWIFSANNESISNRARWPFVNPNHLGIFLIIPLFLAIGKIGQSIRDLKLAASQLRRRGKIILSELISDYESQKITRSIILLTLITLTISLAITASLSRNAITSALFCLMLFFLFPGARQKKLIPDKFKNSQIIETVVSDSINLNGRIRRRSKQTRSRESRGQPYGINISKFMPFLVIFSRFTLVLVSIGIFWFFLGEKGGDLFKSRLEYALIYSQDDMRWQLYKDSLTMLWEAPLWGVGLGNWSALYPQYMAEGLSGMKPGYLHSDILQTVIELGFIGAVIFLFSTIYISILIFKNSSRKEKSEQVSVQSKTAHSRSLFYGFLALLLSSAFEFPFRIPAIVAIFAISLALEVHSISYDKRQPPNDVLGSEV